MNSLFTNTRSVAGSPQIRHVWASLGRSIGSAKYLSCSTILGELARCDGVEVQIILILCQVL